MSNGRSLYAGEMALESAVTTTRTVATSSSSLSSSSPSPPDELLDRLPPVYELLLAGRDASSVASVGSSETPTVSASTSTATTNRKIFGPDREAFLSSVPAICDPVVPFTAMNDCKNQHTDDVDDNDGDDDFFGPQSDNDGNAQNEFGSMGAHEFQARENELRNIGFVDAYDEYKESTLQEGFEAGFQETFEASILLGKLLGEVTTLQKLKDRPLAGSNLPMPSSSIPWPTEPNVNAAISLVQNYFTNRFQKDESNNATQDIETLLHGIQTLLEREEL